MLLLVLLLVLLLSLLLVLLLVVLLVLPLLPLLLLVLLLLLSLGQALPVCVPLAVPCCGHRLAPAPPLCNTEPQLRPRQHCDVSQLPCALAQVRLLGSGGLDAAVQPSAAAAIIDALWLAAVHDAPQVRCQPAFPRVCMPSSRQCLQCCVGCQE